MFFPCFYGLPPYRGPGTAPFDAFRSLLAELGLGARSFAGAPEGCCLGRAWHSRAAAGGRVALGRAIPKRGILNFTREEPGALAVRTRTSETRQGAKCDAAERKYGSDWASFLLSADILFIQR